MTIDKMFVHLRKTKIQDEAKHQKHTLKYHHLIIIIIYQTELCFLNIRIVTCTSITFFGCASDEGSNCLNWPNETVHSVMCGWCGNLVFVALHNTNKNNRQYAFWGIFARIACAVRVSTFVLWQRKRCYNGSHFIYRILGYSYRLIRLAAAKIYPATFQFRYCAIIGCLLLFRPPAPFSNITSYNVNNLRKILSFTAERIISLTLQSEGWTIRIQLQPAHIKYANWKI